MRRAQQTNGQTLSDRIDVALPSHMVDRKYFNIESNDSDSWMNYGRVNPKPTPRFEGKSYVKVGGVGERSHIHVPVEVGLKPGCR
jgi:hypothetical protein